MPLIDAVELHDHVLGRGLRATRPIPVEMPILEIRGTPVAAPDRYSIQIDEDHHLLPDGQAWGFLNHSCAPNCRIAFGDWTVVATREIGVGEELTFDYLTTEWEMATPFECHCGAVDCRGLIQGFKHLSPEAQVHLVSRCSPYLARRLAEAVSVGQG
ncbi:MAG: SET domain-containing methyltransferase [Candidatus Latescibacterota bacterium]|jgi:hypothetical protein